MWEGETSRILIYQHRFLDVAVRNKSSRVLKIKDIL